MLSLEYKSLLILVPDRVNTVAAELDDLFT